MSTCTHAPDVWTALNMGETTQAWGEYKLHTNTQARFEPWDIEVRQVRQCLPSSTNAASLRNYHGKRPKATHHTTHTHLNYLQILVSPVDVVELDVMNLVFINAVVKIRFLLLLNSKCLLQSAFCLRKCHWNVCVNVCRHLFEIPGMGKPLPFNHSPCLMLFHS